MNLIFGIALGMAIIGLFLIKYILTLLERKHLNTYKELGEPSIFWNNSAKNNFLFYGFLFKRKYLKLNDRLINILCNILLFYFIIYTVLIITLFFLILSLASKA